jgi:lipopolysaccharide export LptBFGC system permease protein LptF
MNPRMRALLQIGLLVAVILALFLVFPKAFAFVEMAARELRYLWWLILLLALGVWLIWGLRKKPK